MDIVIVDSDILIDFSRGAVFAAEWLNETESGATLAVSSITEMELMVGARNKAHLSELKRFLRRFQILHLNEQISALSIKLIEKFTLSHGLLVPDALIAATAMSLDCQFASKNQRDFRFIDDLRLIKYP